MKVLNAETLIEALEERMNRIEKGKSLKPDELKTWKQATEDCIDYIRAWMDCWHDPTDLPETGEEVLVVDDMDMYWLAKHDPFSGWVHSADDEPIFDEEIVGWCYRPDYVPPEGSL